MASQNHSQDVAKIQEAIFMVKNENVTIATASKTFGIPYSTLRDKLTGRRPIEPKSKYLLTELEERKLVKWIRTFAERCMGRSYNDIRDKVREIILLRGGSTRTDDGRPSKDWMQAFMKRRPEISLRTTQALGRERAYVSTESVAQWFNGMKEFLDKTDPQLLRSPDRIFNADETGFALAPGTKKVLAPKGMSHVYQLTNNTRQQLTVLGCGSAAGEIVPPMIIYPRKRMPTTNLLDGFDEAFMQLSHNGWMNATIFKSWLMRSFAEFVKDKPKPVVLFIDGHASHNTDLEALDFCSENGIILYGLLPHASHIIQPLDLTVFGSCKKKWPAIVKKNLDKTGETATQTNFARLLKQVWDTCAKPEICINGFIRSGIFPFNPSNALGSGKMEAAKSFIAHPATDTTTSAAATIAPSGDAAMVLSAVTSSASTGDRAALTLPAAGDTGAVTLASLTNITPVNQETAPQNMALTCLTDFIKLTHKIGLDKSLSYADVLVSGGDCPEEDFSAFRALMPNVTSTSAKNIPQSCRQSCSSTHNQNPSTTLDDILKPPALLKNRNNTNKKNHTSLNMAFTSLEYRNYLRKKSDDLKKAEEEKERKKIEREEVRVKKLAEKREKQEKRMLEMEKKKKEKEEMAKKKKREKLLREKERKKRRRVEESREDAEDNNVRMVLESDDEVMEDEDPSKCKECGGKEGTSQ